MAKDRIYTSSQYRTVVDALKANDVLGMNIVEGKEAFLLAVALGLNDPIPLKNKIGLFLNTALKTSDKALIAYTVLGSLAEDQDIDEYANFDKASDFCEQCAEAGYQVLQKKYNDANCDEELLERRMIKELELLYAQSVAADF